MSTKRSWFRKKTGTSAASSSSKAGSYVESASTAVVAEASGSSHRGASFESREFSLFVHGLDFSDQDLVVNPESFPEVRAGDILEIYTSLSGGSSGPAIIRIKTVGPVKGNVSVSVSASMAELFRLRRGVIVTLKFADASTVGLLRATVSFKDYVSRSEMWRFKAESVGRVLYHSKSLSIASINVHVKDLVGSSGDVNCGIITDQTKLVFRSRSAHFTLALQMSMEMWEFAEDGDLYLERVRAVIGMHAHAHSLPPCEYFLSCCVLAFETAWSYFYAGG